MTAEILNLRRARKARSRRDAEQTAAENRARFGRTKAERLLAQRDEERSTRQLDGALRDRADGADEPVGDGG